MSTSATNLLPSFSSSNLAYGRDNVTLPLVQVSEDRSGDWSSGTSPARYNEFDIPTDGNSLYHSYVGYPESLQSLPIFRIMYTPENVQLIRSMVMNGTEGVDPQGRKIWPSDRMICAMMSNVIQNGTRKSVGDIYSRYIIPAGDPRNDIVDLNKMTATLLIQGIRDEYETIANNERLSIWDTVLGDFNRQGLRSYPPLKMRRREPQRMMFNMNY